VSWPELPLWVLWVSLAVNIASTVFSVRNGLRLRRAVREAANYGAYLCLGLQRIAMLDNLLMSICCNAAGRDTGPIWQAWAETMGCIQLSIRGTFRGRAWGAELFPGGPEDVAGLVREHGEDDGELDAGTDRGLDEALGPVTSTPRE